MKRQVGMQCNLYIARFNKFRKSQWQGSPLGKVHHWEGTPRGDLESMQILSRLRQDNSCNEQQCFWCCSTGSPKHHGWPNVPHLHHTGTNVTVSGAWRCSRGVCPWLVSFYLLHRKGGKTHRASHCYNLSRERKHKACTYQPNDPQIQL